MKKATALVVMLALLLGSTAGVALTAQVSCRTGPKAECRGEEEDDNILGTREKDGILALDDRDYVIGGNNRTSRRSSATRTTTSRWATTASRTS